jgi:PAS domain S-box-containing protein
MISQVKSKRILSFLARFVFPTVVTIALFLTAFFSIIIPAIEKNSLDRKREMIRELTTSAWNIFAKLDSDEKRGLLTKEQAQRQAIDQIRNLHYGREMKDYFWINDMHPRMVVHPYRSDLDGKDLSTYTDSEGKRIFIEMVKLVESEGDGYVEYMWQWKDEETRILPKISYVKGFTPWGWIIGTGIYVDDVKAEIESITGDLIKISLFILLIIVLLLVFIAEQSYRALQEQQDAENALRESEEKYRTLVESAAEGMFMAIEGRFMYVNQTIADMLGYSTAELSEIQAGDIFYELNEFSGNEYISDLLEGRPVPERFETRLKTKAGLLCDVTLSATQISLGGRNGFMAVVSDITNRKKAEDELGASEEKFRTMANNLNVGFFRMTTDKNPRFIEANPALAELLGYESRESLLSVPVLNFYVNQDEYNRLAPQAGETGLKREVVKFRRKDGSVFNASIWGVRIHEGEGQIRYFDGIMEDITEVIEREEESRKLLSEMQSTLMYFSRQIDHLKIRNLAICSPELSIRDAARLMSEQVTDIVLVRDEAGRDAGTLTDYDLRKVLADSGHGPESPVSGVMSQKVLTLPGRSSVFEAWILMTHNSVSHLFVTNIVGDITGVLHGEDILAIQHYSPSVLLWEIQSAVSHEDIASANRILPFLITTLIESGAKPQNINHLTTMVSDTIVKKFIEFAIDQLGPPPVKFSFVVFGSEGREEQTLRTDQDNAIIYEDPSPGTEKSASEYFLLMGEKVCTWLNDAGYTFCDGKIMAMNPEYCQPLSVWKQYFSKWVFSATGEDLLRAKIFFDFRTGYGDEIIEHDLREHLNSIVPDNSRFFQLLARNILIMAPPIGRFGNFIVESSGEHRGSFDIKASMMPIIDFARIYALKNRIRTANTMMRLAALHEMKVLTDLNYQEMIQAYTYLMQIRLRIQAEAVSRLKKNPDNYVCPKNLTSIEQKLLKEIFSQTKNFQVRLSYDFTGQIGGL